MLPTRAALKRRLLPLLPGGVSLVLKQIEVVFRCYFARRFYEPEQEFVLRLLDSIGVGTVVDVGSNQGQYALALSKRGSCEQVIGINPQGEIVALLSRTLKILGIENVTILKVLAGERKGRASVSIPITDGYAARQEAFMTFAPASAAGSDIDVVALDDVMKECVLARSRVTFLKADVEGAELLVLKGASQLIAEHEPFIMLEVSQPYLRRFSCTFEDVEGLLAESGYRPYVLERSCLAPFVRVSDIDSNSMNVMFLTQRHLEHARRVDGLGSAANVPGD
ncbi:MAG: FkbM family methyltransferase [Gemmatimonadetes bacterium]|nr:FkbM family methyltransferase [Gemmatimonadota bacterium]